MQPAKTMKCRHREDASVEYECEMFEDGAGGPRVEVRLAEDATMDMPREVFDENYEIMERGEEGQGGE